MQTQRSGVEVDYCPRCQGLWLDRGELEKLVAREQQVYGVNPTTRDLSEGLQGRSSGGDYRSQPPRDDYREERRYEKRDRDDRYHDERHSDDRYRDDRYREGRRRKKGLLGELLDIFD